MAREYRHRSITFAESRFTILLVWLFLWRELQNELGALSSLQTFGVYSPFTYKMSTTRHRTVLARQLEVNSGGLHSITG